MVMELNVLDYVRRYEDSLEISLLKRLGRDDEPAAHKQALQQLWGSEAAPWKRW
jgi:hypothetical protein